MKSNKELLYSKLKKITTDEYEKYLEEERNGFINIKHHPEDDNIVILNYNEKTTFERRWNHETMTARGLILDLTSATNNEIHVLASPFPKFFNIGENPEYEEGYQDWKVESVMEKMDGSLGISYYFNDEIRFATRGSFVSEQAIKATEIWREKYRQFHNMKIDVKVPVTYLVEIIYPENRVVVDYGKQEELVMLGITYISENSRIPESPYSDLKYEAELLKMKVAEEYKFSIDEMLNMKSMIDPNEEGWVVKFTNGKRLKIKGDQYMSVQRIMHGLSIKAKYKAWFEGRLDLYIMQLPEEFRGELESFREYVEEMTKVMGEIVASRLHSATENAESTDHKDFAKYVSSNYTKVHRGFIFEMKKTGKVPEDRIKYFIYKNYIDYEMGFDEWQKNSEIS